MLVKPSSTNDTGYCQYHHRPLLRWIDCRIVVITGGVITDIAIGLSTSVNAVVDITETIAITVHIPWLRSNHHQRA